VTPHTHSSVLDAVPDELYIDGAFVAAGSGDTFAVVDPSTGAIVAQVADADLSEIDAAIAAAEGAASSWAATPPRARADVLMRAFDSMMSNREDLARLISIENGKALPDARSEVEYAAEFFRWYAEEIPRLQGSIQRSPSGRYNILADYQPAGVAVLVTPWNFPAAMATRKIAPAVAAGCTAILKPAKETPLTALAIAQILHEAGLPAGVLNVVTTTRAQATVSRLLAAASVRVLSFTGSTEVGRTLLREAAANVVKPAMELGGNAPFLVLEGSDIDTAVEGAIAAKLRNGGQACTAANRFYVHRSLHDEFAERLAEHFDGLRVGVGYDGESDLGPLVNRASVDKVSWLVADAAAARCPMTGSSTRRRCSPGCTPTPRSSARRSSGRWRRSSPSTTSTRPSGSPTGPSTAWSRTCSPTILLRVSRPRSGWNRGWSA
jgi:succinate-semialdehyde dehydrogenase/glutarate-semialdehyde dehydrogenase